MTRRLPLAGIIGWDAAMLALAVLAFRTDGAPSLITVAMLAVTVAVQVRVFLP
jgi:hypothetical protein